MADLPTRPELGPWYRTAWRDGGIVLEYGEKVVVLEGRATEKLLPALLPLLDGERTVDEIVSELGDAAAPAVAQALLLLARHGVLTEGHRFDGDDRASDAARFLAATSTRGSTPAEAEAAVAEAAVAVAGTGRLAREVGQMLRLSGVRRLEHVPVRAREDVRADLVVAAPSGEELPGLVDWNEHALRNGVPWLQVLPHDGRCAAIGPLYVPSETCCYECFRLRRASNSGFEDEYWALAAVQRRLPATASIERAAAGLAAELALRWLVDRAPAIPGVLYALEVGPPIGLTRHVVYRVPRCGACSSTSSLAPVLPWHQGDA